MTAFTQYSLSSKMHKCLLLTLTTLVFSTLACADNGLVSIKSPYSVSTTADRLESILKAKGMTVFIKINHATAAANVDSELRPTQVIIFGNPKVGTPLMQCRQSIAIDLPQKALIWQDENDQVWLSYNDPHYLAQRHAVAGCDQVLNKIAKALSQFAAVATTPPMK